MAQGMAGGGIRQSVSQMKERGRGGDFVQSTKIDGASTLGAHRNLQAVLQRGTEECR